MEQLLMYSKSFSALLGLQNQKELRYSLFARDPKCGSGHYEIIVEEISGGYEDRTSVDMIAVSRQQAEQVVMYLYENAVPVSHCHAIVSDVCCAVRNIEGDQYGTDENPIAHCG